MAELGAQWYLIQVVTNHEQKVKESLEKRDFQEGKNSATIEEVLLPMMNHETKTGRFKKKPMFTGYLFVKVEMTDEAWFIIRNTQYVTGIVGSAGQRTKPTPVPDEQIQRIIERVKEESLMMTNFDTENTQKLTSVNYVEGDTVLIKEGDFANQEGTVKSISIPKQSAAVELEFFGRLTAIELPLSIIIRK